MKNKTRAALLKFLEYRNISELITVFEMSKEEANLILEFYYSLRENTTLNLNKTNEEKK